MYGIINRLTLIVAGLGVCVAQSGNTTSPKERDKSPIFLKAPQRIHYYVTRNQSANLTWAATNVCKIQIKCNRKKFQDGVTRVCGKSCRNCRTRMKTKIVTDADFPKDTRIITCQCKVWGKIAVRTDKIILEKAFLRRNFGTVRDQLHHVVSPNTSVVLQCKPPGGSPSPNITWYKNGKPLFLPRGRRIRLRSRNDLIIKRVQMRDSGEYQCVAKNMAARREGPVMTLDVRENSSTAVCTNENQWPCTSQLSPDCKSGSNISLDCGGEREKKAVLRLNKSDGGGDEVIVSDLNKPIGLKILHRRKETQGEGEIKSKPNSPTDPSLVVVILLIVILVAVVLGFVVNMIKKRCPYQRSQSTNPEDINDEDDRSLDLTDHTELTRAGSHLNNEPSNLNGEGSTEPFIDSGTAREDSPVASRRNLVVYVTKVEVEQHGGVTVVGDDAKVHHHYSPQS